MAGIVNDQSQLIVTGGGSGPGTNVTVVGPLGSKPAASSVSVALASDQLPLPFTSGDGNQFGPFTFNGAFGSTTINTPGGGSLIILFQGTATGAVLIEEQLITAGPFVRAQSYVVPAASALNNPLQNFEHFTAPFGANLGTSFIAVVTVKGIAVKITDGITSGSLTVEGIYKANLISTRPVIEVGAVNGFGADVNTHNEKMVSLINQNDNTATQWIGMPTSDAVNASVARLTTLVATFPHFFNGTNWDRVRGDATFGLKTQGALGTLSGTTVWNNATALNSTIVVSVAGLQEVIFQSIFTGPIVNGAVTFEATIDGTNWFAIPVVINQNGVIKPVINSVLAILSYLTTNVQILISCAGYTSVRARLSTAITNTGNLSITNITSTINSALSQLKPTIVAGGVNPNLQDVNSQNEAEVTLVNSGSQVVLNTPFADGYVNPASKQTIVVGAVPYLWNGFTFDRAPGDLTYGAKVQGSVGSAQGSQVWNNALPINSALIISTGGNTQPAIQSLIIQSIYTGPITGGAFTFEGTIDALNWIPIPVIINEGGSLRPVVSTSISIPGNLTSNTQILIDCSGFVGIRHRLSTVITGAGNLLTNYNLSTVPITSLGKYQPAPLYGLSQATGIVEGPLASLNGILQVDIAAFETSIPVVIGGPLGEQPSIGSVSVAIASDQNPIDVTLTGSSVLPINAAQETGGNLDTIVAQNKFFNRMVQLMQMQNALLRGIYLQLGSMTGVAMNVEELTETSIQ